VAVPVTRLVVPVERVIVEERARPEAAAEAAAAYLDSFCLFGGGGAGLVKPQLAHGLLACGGFDDGVDLAWSLVFYFLTALAPPLRPALSAVEGEDDVRDAFRGVGLRFGELIGRAEFDPTLLFEAVVARGGGPDGLRLAVGGDSIEAFILLEVIRKFYHEAFVATGRYLEDRALVQREALDALREHAEVHLISFRERPQVDGLLLARGLTGAYDELHTVDDVTGPAAVALVRRALPDAEGDLSCFVVCPTVPMVKVVAALEGPVPIGYATGAEHRRPLAQAGSRAVVSRLGRLARVLART
jgi:hypothetical protein